MVILFIPVLSLSWEMEPLTAGEGDHDYHHDDGDQGPAGQYDAAGGSAGSPGVASVFYSVETKLAGKGRLIHRQREVPFGFRHVDFLFFSCVGVGGVLWSPKTGLQKTVDRQID